MAEISCPICKKFSNPIYLQKNNFTLYKCLACGLVFVWPFPENLSDIYGEQYFKNSGSKHGGGYTDYDADKEPMRRIFENYLEKFARLTSGRKLFDIGAATGYFLDLAKNQGWETYGIEISPYAAQEAARRGHKVINGLLPLAGIEDKFDLVTMWDVLEHLNCPDVYLKTVNKILRSGGYLAINTIDISSWWARWWGKRWPLIIPPEHLMYFTPDSLKKLLQSTGFKIVEVRKRGKKFSLPYIFKIFSNWLKSDFFYRLADFFNRPFWRKCALPINLRDNIFIIAKKIDEL